MASGAATMAAFRMAKIPRIQKPTTRNNTIEKAKFEVVPGLRWAGLGDAHHGLSLMNKMKYGYDVAANVLRLSLWRSPTSPDLAADRGRHRTPSLPWIGTTKKPEDSNSLIIRMFEWAGKDGGGSRHAAWLTCIGRRSRHDGEECNSAAASRWIYPSHRGKAVRDQDDPHRLQ
jgi:hypothetical protein